jgi:hypothetical protein
MLITVIQEAAVGFFSEAEWGQIGAISFPEGARVFRVPDSTPTGPILGMPASYEVEEEEIGPEITMRLTKEVSPAVPPMTHAEVEAIATELLYPAAPTESPVTAS